MTSSVFERHVYSDTEGDAQAMFEAYKGQIVQTAGAACRTGRLVGYYKNGVLVEWDNLPFVSGEDVIRLHAIPGARHGLLMMPSQVMVPRDPAGGDDTASNSSPHGVVNKSISTGLNKAVERYDTMKATVQLLSEYQSGRIQTVVWERQANEVIHNLIQCLEPPK